ncbi:MAG: nucleotidyltransferase [Ignavibacteriaceae bacterium]
MEYVIIGGIAVVMYGEQRTTEDIDVTILCNLENLDFIHGIIEKKFTPAFKGTLDYFKKNFILPVDDPDTKLRIDFAAGLTEFDKQVISRRKRKNFGKSKVYVCSLEDLIIYKLFAARHLDIADVQNLLEKNKSSIDKNYLTQTIEKFVELERGDMIQNLKKFLS